MAEKKNKVGPVTFFQQVQAEGAKVTWTSRAETTSATILVIIMSVIVSVFLFLGDQIWSTLVRMITGLGT